MRASGELVPVSQPSPVEDAEKERRRRRRPARRPKQTLPNAAAPEGGVDAAASRPYRSMPAMRVDGESDAEAETVAAAEGVSRSCHLPAASCPVEPRGSKTSSISPGKQYFEPHLPEEAVEEAVKRGNALKGKFRVNAYNRNEAYCTIDGLQVDVLLSGASQNRAVEGDLVAILLDPVVYWTKMKGPNVPCTPGIGGDYVVREVGETNRNHVRRKGQTDASCRFENCNNGLPVSDGMHQYHKNSGFSQAVHCENGNAMVPESYEEIDEGKTEAARVLERIRAMIYSHPNKRPTGKVLSVVKKSPRRDAVIGFLAPFSELPDEEQQRNQTSAQGSTRKSHRVSSSGIGLIHLLPTDPKFPKMIVSFSTLPDNVRESLKEGNAAIERELVAARIEEWDEESLYPRAHVIQLLGKGGQIETQIGAILFENAICASKFSPESTACLPDMSWKIPQEEFEARKDLRNILTFTIDPPTAIDLDDALSIEIISGGITRIGVHIADVSYFVHPESALDTEAQSRSTSVYILQNKISMLPPKLSEELASLNPGVDRLAFSIIWDIDPHGNIVNRWIGRTVIFSCCKLSYDLVKDIISVDASQFRCSGISTPQVHGRFEWGDVLKSLRCLHQVTKNLKEMRFKGGALSLETAKLMILFDEGGTPRDSYRHERNDACSIVEELMLLANMSAAEVISNAFPDCALLRKHPKPNMRKLREFEAFCAKNGFELDASSSGQLHLSLSRIREELKDDPVLFDILLFYASKQMQSAAYFCTGDLRSKKDDWAHYALSVPLYTHFTSPLRRYPDIVVHRTLYAVIEAEEIYLKQQKSFIGGNRAKAASEIVGRCFTSLQFNQDAAESKEGREALLVAAKKFKVPGSKDLGEVAEYCNERKWASRRAEEAGEKLYIWALLKRKEILISNARVLGLGPRFMSVYVPKLAMVRRIYYDEVESLTVEWLETTGTLVLDASKNKPPHRRGSPVQYRAIKEVAVVVNPSELCLSKEDEESGATEAEDHTAKSVVLGDAMNAQTAPAALPLVIQHLNDIPVALHATGGEDGALNIGVRLYISSYFM